MPEMLRRPAVHHLTMAHDQDPITDVQGDGELLFDQQHRHLTGTQGLEVLRHLVHDPANLPELPAVSEFTEAIGQTPPQARIAALCFDKLDVETGMEVRSPDGKVRRLFENYVEVERAYFRKTRIFPIMHTVVIRREVYEQNRWIAMSLYKAFAEAQKRVYDNLLTTSANSSMLPWQMAHVEEARRELGEDWWAYGFEPNRHVLDTFLRYHHEQGLSKRRLKPEELFAPETLEAFKI